jgi:hypothetical protein
LSVSDSLVKHVWVYLDTKAKGARVDLEVRASVSFRTVEPLPRITTRERSIEERERREHAVQNMNHTQQGQERVATRKHQPSDSLSLLDYFTILCVVMC